MSICETIMPAFHFIMFHYHSIISFSSFNIMSVVHLILVVKGLNPGVISYRQVSTWSLRNYFIITRLEQEQNIFLQSHFESAYFSSFLPHVEIISETINTCINSCEFTREPYPVPDLNGRSLYTFSDQKGPKTLPGLWGGTAGSPSSKYEHRQCCLTFER